MLARGIRKMIHLLKFESGLAADQDLAMDPPHREPEKELVSELGPMAFHFSESGKETCLFLKRTVWVTFGFKTNSFSFTVL